VFLAESFSISRKVVAHSELKCKNKPEYNGNPARRIKIKCEIKTTV
jgi:hypothetical protein